MVGKYHNKAEYVAASVAIYKCFGFRNKLLDYGDCNEKKLIQMVKIHTDKNVADLLTKAFDEKQRKDLTNDETALSNGIELMTGDSKLMLLGITYYWLGYYCWVKVNAVETRYGENSVCTADQVSTVRPEVSAAGVHVNVSVATLFTPPTTRTIFGDEDLTIAQTLVKMRKRQKQEEATRVLIAEELDEIQAIIDVDHELVYTHQHLKHKNFKEVQKLYDKEKKWINDFKRIDDDSQQQAESTKKRPRTDSEEESSKKQKLEEDNDAEKEELRDSMDIVPKDDVAIDVESLTTKYPIVDWKAHILNENIMYYQIIRADGSSKNYKIFSKMLDDFDRQDVIDLHRMLNRRLEVDYESEMAFELLRFTRSQLQK
ncbi:hypothetical protein Tco_0596459 [Tanacetum coccineum]